MIADIDFSLQILCAKIAYRSWIDEHIPNNPNKVYAYIKDYSFWIYAEYEGCTRSFTKEELMGWQGKILIDFLKDIKIMGQYHESYHCELSNEELKLLINKLKEKNK